MAHAIKTEMADYYKRIHVIVGVIGVGLPIFLFCGSFFLEAGLEPTISDFYHTIYRDFFVGVLFVVGLILMVYRGYDRGKDEVISDSVLASLAGGSAIGVALFPNESQSGLVATLTQSFAGVALTPLFHYVFAGVFFISLACFCLTRFASDVTEGRRTFYHICGYAILVFLFLTIIAAAIRRYAPGPAEQFVVDFKLIFVFESCAVIAFGLSWLKKGIENADVVNAAIPLNVVPADQSDTASNQEHAAMVQA